MGNDFDYIQMLKGELYLASGIHKENKSIHGKKLIQKINNMPIEEKEKIIELEKELLGKTGKNIYINPPFYVNYGRHIEIGENFYANMDCLFLDVNKIIIGDNVMLGPRVGIYTAGHPIDAEIRNSGLEFGLPVVIQDNVWIGANSTLLPNITIGANSIVAAGSVVTKNVPENSIYGGNPAKLIRKIEDTDFRKWNQLKETYYQEKESFFG